MIEIENARISEASRGRVFLPSPEGESFSHRHEWITRTGIARRLAALKGYEFAGEYVRSRHGSGPAYLVPGDALVGAEAAEEFGIRDEHDLFGGVVPHAFVATKSITHPLVGPQAFAPRGWSHRFGHQVRDAVHRGFSAFTLDDAYVAGARLLERGPLRIKPVRATGGRGQKVVADAGALQAALDGIDAMDLPDFGLVLEEDLSDVVTYSVGQVRVADLVATYHGTQRLTANNAGETVYGGSTLFVVRGGFETLLEGTMPEEIRLAVAQARAYDGAATECFPGLIASRRNYDVAVGTDIGGRRRSGVLEQSWRAGGASTAEVAALEAFRAEPALQAVRASSIEIYGNGEDPPPQADVYFRGNDERDGFMTKYALVEAADDAR